MKCIHVSGLKIDTVQKIRGGKDGYIFYANEYLGTGYLLNGTKNKTIASSKNKKKRQ